VDLRILYLILGKVFDLKSGLSSITSESAFYWCFYYDASDRSVKLFEREFYKLLQFNL